MEKHIEKEYKLLVDKESFDALIAHYPNLEPITQINYYFDNDNQDILKSHGAMRIRTKKNRHIFTLKKFEDGDLFEYECFVDGNTKEILNQKEIQTVLNSYHFDGPFHLIGELKTIRSMYVEDNFELCFDINYHNDTIDYEIEYEYRKEHDGFTHFNQILAQENLEFKENAKSKIERALSL